MNGAKQILASLRLVNSFLLTRSSTTRSLHYQVTHYSPLSPCFHSPLQKQPSNFNFRSTHQTANFSSKPNSVVELILTNEWSEELEHELEKSNTTPTHETVLYVLKKLERNPQKASNFFNWVSHKIGFKPSLSVYSLMLRVLGRKEFMKDFWAVIKKMEHEGYDLDAETYSTLMATFSHAKMGNDAVALSKFMTKTSHASSIAATVKQVAEVILGSDWNNEVENKLGEMNLPLSENAVVSIIRELRRYPLKALRFFRWVEEHLDYKHNVVTYNTIVRVLGQEESVKEFWEVVKEMKNAAYDMDIDTYIKISRQFQKTKMMKDAVELYEFMMDGPYKPSVQDCSFLLRHISLSNAPDLSLVYRVVKKYEATGHLLSKAVYDGIHRSLTSVGNFDEAEKIVDTMKNAGYEPDNITYSQLVFGLCKAGRFDEACDVLDEMEAEGCAPDIKTWTILIQGHCLAGKVDEALKFFTTMLENNFDVDADLLSVLVNGLCSKNMIDSAYSLITSMVDKAKSRPWQATYKDMIQKLLGERKLEEALNLLRLMKKQNFPPFPEPFIDYISKFGTVDDAREFLKALSVKQYPSTSAYVHIFRSFFREGRQSEAQDLLFNCPHHIRSHAEISILFGSLKQENPTA